ncbi:alpha/beta fold hydrolase [Microbacterium sp. QXD-8]|uniref:Alpha/beta fold hydrolase n=1 Tax=Microbacterium psychrotolerans TaxID=3068321 RepID=A0ABU0YXL6_9MICO|nr:alpha/beta fold hydrolase [Microbacterium sp. QXD-8]MDQ7877069.1 alpha/beta fold hydrolase [Microbacterium sp. QXD-8]
MQNTAGQAALSAARRKTRRLLTLSIAGLPVMLACVGHLVETTTLSRERDEFPAKGKLITVGDSNWHLYCTGEPSSLPPLLLEAGLGDSSANWSDVQTELSADRRVCSYDRLGYGWSSPARGDRIATQEAGELAAVISAAREVGPFIVVAHSMGALIAREFAAAYPEFVHGLVLLDPTNEKTLADASAVALSATGLQVVASSVGLTRPFVREQLRADAQGPLPRQVEQQAGFLYRYDALGTSFAELQAASSEVAAIDVPTVVVFAADVGRADRAHYASLGDDITIVVAKTTAHYIQYADLDTVRGALTTLDLASSG